MGAARRLDLSPGRGRSEELVVRWRWRDKSEASALKRRAREAGYAAPTGQYGNPLNKYIKHYEGLSYDVDSLHQKHQRAKRAVLHEDQFLHLNFHAHG
ncbi:hypothetical protein KIL84_014626, partial [Mauremys mutica]